MKKIAIVGAIVVVVTAAVIKSGFSFGNVTEVMKEVQTVTETVEVHPDWAEDPDAVKAAQDVIRKKELQAQEAQLVEEISAKQDELDAIRKELGSY